MSPDEALEFTRRNAHRQALQQYDPPPASPGQAAPGLTLTPGELRAADKLKYEFPGSLYGMSRLEIAAIIAKETADEKAAEQALRVKVEAEKAILRTELADALLDLSESRTAHAATRRDLEEIKKTINWSDTR